MRATIPALANVVRGALWATVQRVRRASDVAFGSIASFWHSASHFRSTPNSGHHQIDPVCPVRAKSLIRQTQSIRTLPNHIDYVSTRRTDSQGQLLSCNRDKALLVRGIPVWKGTAFDVNCDAAICLAYRICSEVCYRAVGRFFVFVRGAQP